MKRNIFVGVLAMTLAFSTWATDSTFAAGTSDEQKLKNIQQEQSKVKKELSESKSELDEKKKKLQEVEKKVEAYDQQIAKLYKDLQANQELLEKSEKQFKNLLVRMYEKGEMHYTARLLEAKSFTDFLARFETVRLILEQEKAVLNRYVEYKEKVEKEKAELEAKKKEQEPLLEAAKKEYEEVEKTYKKYSQSLSKLEKEEELTKEAIEEKNRLARQASGVKVGNYGTGQFRWPTTSCRVSSGFGWRSGGMHEGIDIPNSLGQPIYAADSGTVTLMKDNPGGYGYYIIINHGNGFQTLYAHMYRSTVTVSLGQKVSKGQRIASIGNNGRSTGPHLHFELHKNGNPVDPLRYMGCS